MLQAFPEVHKLGLFLILTPARAYPRAPASRTQLAGSSSYENVQVSPVPGGPSSLAASGLGGKAGMESGVGGALARGQRGL